MTAITGVSDRTFGLFLNMGANLAPTTAGVFDLTLREADAAEQLGYDELWVTEHHFIRFGINPSALTTAGFLLGRTERIRVGTAVTLSPLLHPVEMAERSATVGELPDQGGVVLVPVQAEAGPRHIGSLVAPRVAPAIGSSCCILPLRLGRQPDRLARDLH